MEVSEAKRLKALEAENAKLKKMLAEHMLDVATLKEMLGTPRQRLASRLEQEVPREAESVTL